MTAKNNPANESVTLYHPYLQGNTKDVAADAVDAWTKQGWRKTPLGESKKSND